MAKKHVVRAYPAPADAKDNGTIAVAAAPKPAARPAKAKKPAKAPKAPKPAKQPKAAPAKRLSCIDAAAKLIAGVTKPVRAVDLIAEMEKRNLWTSPHGKTPEASLYAGIIREIAARKGDARFKKVDRGLFVAGKGA